MLGNFKDAIARLEQQKAAIDKAIATLREFDDGAGNDQAKPTKGATKTGKKRVMSEEGRQRIAAASRKRWAAIKKAAKKGA